MWRALLLIAWVLVVAWPTQAEGQTWPSRPVKMIFNVAPGAVADVVTRLICKHLSDKFGEQFVVESRSGGDGYIGNQAVAGSKADGYTFLHSPGGQIIVAPHITGRTDFIPLNELVPIAPTVRVTLTLLVRPDFPARDFAEFITYVKANPGKVSYGSAGNGTGLHIAGEMLKLATRTNMLHVPFRGAGPALNDLLGGHIDFMFDPGLGYEHAKAGRLRMIATTAARRHADFPQAPTMTELGIDVDPGPYFGVYAPKGTPRDIIERMNLEVTKALDDPETRQRLDALLLERNPMSPDKFADYIQTENRRYASLVPELGLAQKP